MRWGRAAARVPRGRRESAAPPATAGSKERRANAVPRVPATILESPDGRFKVTATNAGIAFSGPKGTLSFDGEELRTSGNLKLFTELGLTITGGTNLEITSGAATEFTTGANFVQTVGANYSESVGNAYSQSISGAYEQLIGGTALQNVARKSTEVVGGGFEANVEGPFAQTVSGTYKAVSGGTSILQGSKTGIGGSVTCPAAAHVGSKIDSFGKIAKEGSSETVSIC